MNIKKEMEISLQAGEIVGTLYDALLKQLKAPESPEMLTRTVSFLGWTKIL